MPDITDPTSCPPQTERRAHPRFRVAATVEITNERSGQTVAGRLADLGLGGCQVETSETFPLGTTVAISMTREGTAFRAQARTVYALHGKAVGMLFTSMDPAHRRVLETWLATLRETQFLALHRRRSQRVVIQVQVRVSGKNTLDSQFTEEAVTEIISAHGALILLAASVTKGQRLVLANPRTQASMECTVVYFGQSKPDKRRQVGLSFAIQTPGFWKINFPPAPSPQR